jgi:hypothetical protein
LAVENSAKGQRKDEDAYRQGNVAPSERQPPRTGSRGLPGASHKENGAKDNADDENSRY